MKNKTALVLLLCLCVLVFAGCSTEPKVLYQSESLEVIREGNITTVYDLEADEQYTFPHRPSKAWRGRFCGSYGGRYKHRQN